MTERFSEPWKKPFVLFSIIVLLKSCLAYAVVFDDKIPWIALVADIPFAWVLFSLIELFSSKRKLGWYVGANVLVTAVLFAVIMYHKYYGVIVTYHALEQVNQVTAVKNSVFSLLAPYYLLIFTDILILFYVIFRRSIARNFKAMARVKMNRGLAAGVLILSLAICIFNIWPNRASMNEIKQAKDMGIFNYEMYTIFSQKKEDLANVQDITQDRINQLKGVQPIANPAYFGAAKGKNLIIVQMESFQNFLINLKVDGQEVTPNLNKLANDNFYFPHFYQMVGQGNTSDAEFVVNSSFYIPPNGAATMIYPDKILPSLPKLMQSNGYQTATFHTNVIDFWNRRELYTALGWEKWYDAAFFKSDDEFFFGASDEVLFSKATDKMKEMSADGKPFYTQIISMSAHHPYTIPEEKYKMQLPVRYEGTLVGDYIRAQNYADYALGQLFEELKQKGLWDNSVIVLYGDHVGLPMYSLTKNDSELMTEIYGRTYGATDMINIPLIIASEGVTTPKVIDHLGGEVDIMPTVANLLGVSMNNQIHFGQDIINQPANLIPERYYLPSGSFVSGKTLFTPGAGYQDGTRYSLSTDSMTDEGVTEAEYNQALELLHLSDSYVTQLPEWKK